MNGDHLLRQSSRIIFSGLLLLSLGLRPPNSRHPCASSCFAYRHRAITTSHCAISRSWKEPTTCRALPCLSGRHRIFVTAAIDYIQVAPVICLGRRPTGRSHPDHQSLADNAIPRQLPLQSAPGIGSGPFGEAADQVLSGGKRNGRVERSVDHSFRSDPHCRSGPSRTGRSTLADRSRSPLVSKWTALRTREI